MNLATLLSCLQSHSVVYIYRHISECQTHTLAFCTVGELTMKQVLPWTVISATPTKDPNSDSGVLEINVY